MIAQIQNSVVQAVLELPCNGRLGQALPEEGVDVDVEDVPLGGRGKGRERPDHTG